MLNLIFLQIKLSPGFEAIRSVQKPGIPPQNMGETVILTCVRKYM